MRILGIDKKIIVFFILIFLSGCAQKAAEVSPKEYIQKSDIYYKGAVAQYKRLIIQGKDASKLSFELGRLYFSHGEYDLAVNAFKKSGGHAAGKMLALTYYRMGNFTDALEIFNREKSLDDEGNYYYGLTCERLNLFDHALKIYKQVRGREFRAKAVLRVEDIERQGGLINIKDVDSKIARIILEAPDAKLYPQAGALILLADESIEITERNTQESSLHYLVKILNERGKENFAEAGIEYDSTFEKVELEYARTIKPDGKVAYVGSRHIRDVSKYLNFPLYSNARIFIISFPEVSLGATLEYKLKIKRSQLANKKDFFSVYPLQSEEPIISADLSIIMPKEKNLRVKIINEEYNDFDANLKANVEERGTNLVYRWQFKDLPEIVPEPDMPADAEINPSLLFSTFANWGDLYSWWWDLAKDKIKADSSIKEAVKELIKGKPSDSDKARAIYNFCAKNIRYVAVEYGQAGYEPHYAADIFRNKYGDCKDQSILLVTMLKEAGLSASPVLIATKEYYNLNEDFPSALFNHCIAAVYLKDKVIFLDPTAETCSFGDLPLGDQRRRVLVFKEGGYDIEEIPFYPAEHNLVKQELKLKINEDESISGAKINITLGAYGQRQRYWLLYTQSELIQDALKNIIQDISIGAKLDSYNIDNLGNLNAPVVLSYSFHGPEYFTKAGLLRIMPQLTNLDTSLTAKDSRKYPIDFKSLDNREVYIEFAIPESFVLKYMPENINRESPWISFNAEYTFKNNKIYFKQIIKGKSDKVTREEYAVFKDFIENLGRSIKQRIVLEKIR